MAKKQKDGLAELLAIMNDHGCTERDRLNAAVSASRVSLARPGEGPPEAIVWLRKMMADGSAPVAYKRESASAIAFWERRAKKAELTYSVADSSEDLSQWRRVFNGCLRQHLWKHGRWPRDRDVLVGADEFFTFPPHPPELALQAILQPAVNRRARRRRAIDEPTTAFIASEEQRLVILKAIAHAMHVRLAAFEVGRGMGQPPESSKSPGFVLT